MTGKESAEARASGVQVISRAAEILRALQSAPGGLSQAELASRIGLARSTVHRILATLEQEGLVASGQPRGRYRLGPEITLMADAARRALVTHIRPLLEQLSRRLDETVDLSVLDHNQATFVDQVVANHRLRAVSAVGESFPLHCTANGKAFLAAMPNAMVNAVLPRHPPGADPPHDHLTGCAAQGAGSGPRGGRRRTTVRSTRRASARSARFCRRSVANWSR